MPITVALALCSPVRSRLNQYCARPTMMWLCMPRAVRGVVGQGTGSSGDKRTKESRKVLVLVVVVMVQMMG
jgi:hypothetical protein